jgi:hypothetical protein
MSTISRRHRPLLATVVMLAAAIGLGACSSLGLGGSSTRIGSAPYVDGSGKVASETREVGSFHAVSASQGVLVTISTGAPGLIVTAEDNLLSHVTTEVVDGTLLVGVSGSVETHAPLKVAVVPEGILDGLSASTGSTIDAQSLDCGSLAVEASTGSTVRAGGRAGSVDVRANTGSTADLRNVESTTATVDASTGSTIRIDASDAVSGTCVGGSTVTVHGPADTSGVSADRSSTLTKE